MSVTTRCSPISTLGRGPHTLPRCAIRTRSSSLSMPHEPQVIDEHAKEIIAPGYTFGTVTDQIATVVLTKKTPIFWMACFAVGFGLLLLFLLAVAMLMVKGVGIWGLRSPTFWAWDITNFVWWVGIGHA